MSAGSKRADTGQGDTTPVAHRNQPPSGGTTGADEGVVLSPAELRRRRTRNIAIAVTLGALVILFYVMTLARLGSNVMNRPM